MAQGYPPPQQYGENPYAAQNPPQPYGQQPYPAQPQYQQQPYPPQQPYQQQPPQPQQAYQQPYQEQQPYPAQPQYQQPAEYRPPTPKEAGGGRRFLAIVVDWLLAVGLGFVAANAAGQPKTTTTHVAGHAVQHNSGPAVPYFVALLVVGLLVSFLNQVVLARLTGFSVGKGLLAMRVIRSKRVMRPNTWRLTRRWLLGFVFLAVALISEDFDLDDGDIVGMRAVRWKHLQEYQQAAAGLG
ncbi:RDD family protein [Kitasatospora sp. NPDC097643]|uniref:RDD family protein n=1 Tax=Kitasatospora sp. NPDC097643 TaxID=3157230 RepID=UPI00331AE2E8